MIKNPFEAIVIGSGATGGIAALTLAELGVRVLVIEAGPFFNPKEALGSEPLNTFKRIRGILNSENKMQAQHPGFWKANPDLYINEKENRYKTPKNKPFIWTQGRQVGGRSLTWGGITLRLSEENFKASRVDNYGSEWPISYSELEEHYTAIEKLLSIHGNNDGLNQLPDGEYIKPLPFTDMEEEFKSKIFNSLNYKVIHSRGFGPHDINSDGYWPRSSSIGSSLAKALKTGKVELLTNQIVEHIIINKQQNLSTGVVMIDRLTQAKNKLNSKLIVLCASTIQSIKILLNSLENRRTQGLIEPSGKLGSYLMDHISTCRFFSMPSNNIKKVTNQKLTGAGSFFIPFGNNPDKSNRVDFIRGYGIWGGIDRFDPPAFLKKKPQTKTGFLIGHGEVLAYEDNKVTLSNNLDKFGIPIPLIRCEWKENELKMVKHMNKTIENCIKSAGGEINQLKDLINLPFLNLLTKNAFALQDSPPPPGYYVHEVGGAPMGSKRDISVLDKWNRLWECKNVLVVDGACWPTSAWQSPTLTMMALTRRACIKAVKNY
ncbi:GMC oxidoreductase [Prochlorococcus marinus]|uniref:GMC oxidoreductase n=1 Tax=Prochlorococcus marinus TaxID=1219 RepID=UPI0022B31C45|nr:GMC family oxidoreductase [Prochlorococcus marinus]